MRQRQWQQKSRGLRSHDPPVTEALQCGTTKQCLFLFTRETLAGADPVCMNTSVWLYFGVKFALKS